MKYRVKLLLAVIVLIVLPQMALTHCEIPCGIYDDELRFSLLAEHITTIEKSMTKISALSAGSEKNYNQLIRWVTNKEEHAKKFVDIVTQYFMTQRIKEIAPGAEGYDNYVKKLSLLHGMIRSAMKCKQTTDATNPAALSRLLKEFEELYLAGHSH